jgi:antitoxin component YwqK of YwqJK toxin-antitoxin module
MNNNTHLIIIRLTLMLAVVLLPITHAKAQHDTLRGYYPDGTLKYEQVKLDSIRDGHYKRWFPNGVLMMHTNWVMDQQESVQLHYYQSGKLQARYVYKKGKPTLMRHYHENGRRMGISRTNGCRIREKEWTSDGRILRKIKSKGEVSCIGSLELLSDSLQESSLECYCGNIPMKSTNGKYFEPDGTENKRKVRFKKIIYFEDGRKKYESKFANGKGYEREWNSEGNLIKDETL